MVPRKTTWKDRVHRGAVFFRALIPALLLAAMAVPPATAATPATRIDFDGDNTADLAVWRSSNGRWYVKPSSGAAPIESQYGGTTLGDILVPGDYDGDGKADFAVWRPSEGMWYVKKSLGGPDIVAQFGDNPSGDVPVPGDYDGDGKADFAVWRPSNGTWYVKRSLGGPDLVVQWGDHPSGDIPVPADYDGDGRTDFAVWRPSNGKWYVKPASGAPPMEVQYGDFSQGDLPVPADYDGDRKADFAVWRAYNGTWYVKPSLGGADLVAQWGDFSLGDVPVPGDYDGDSRADFAVWRGTGGSWFVKLSSGAPPLVVQWGNVLLGDIPVREGRPRLFSNSDLAGTWDTVRFSNGEQPGWEISNLTVNASGNLVRNGSLDSAGAVKGFEDLLLRWVVDGFGSVRVYDTSVTPFVRNLSYHGTLNLKKNLVVATDNSGSTNNLTVARKQLPSVTYSDADVRGKAFVYHGLYSGLDNSWEYAYGFVDSLGDVYLDNVTTPAGTFPGFYATRISVNAAGIVTDNTGNFHGVMSPDKTAFYVVRTAFPGEYGVFAVHLRGAAYAPSDIGGTKWYHTMNNGAGNATNWGRGRHYTDPGSGSVTYDNTTTFNPFGHSNQPTNEGLLVDPSGTVTSTVYPTHHGQLSAGRDAIARTRTNQIGSYGFSILLK